TDRARAKRLAGEIDAALADHAEAIRLDPKNPVRWNSRGGLYEENKKDYQSAILDYSKAIDLNSKDPLYYVNRGNAYSPADEHAKSVADYTQALELDPKDVTTRTSRGWVYRNGLKEYEKASQDYEAALAINPNASHTLFLYAWHLSTCPNTAVRNGRLAVQLATRAVQLSGGKNAEHVDTLACAYAELGDFDRAVVWEKEAISLIKDTDDRFRFTLRLQLFS